MNQIIFLTENWLLVTPVKGFSQKTELTTANYENNTASSHS